MTRAIPLVVAGAMLLSAGFCRDASAQTGSRLPTAFNWYYQHEPKGWRYWSQIDDTTWVERYDSGEARFTVSGIATVNGCRGILMTKENRTLQAFVPAAGCAQQIALFQFLGASGPQGPWYALGRMERTSYAKVVAPVPPAGNVGASSGNSAGPGAEPPAAPPAQGSPVRPGQ
jgi:hypothetical protein